MKVAYILPKLANKGPILVAQDIAEAIGKEVDLIDVYYFDNLFEVDFKCNCFKISFFSTIDFNKYDVVHSHMLRPDLFVWLKRKKKHNKVKFISTLHQDIYENLRSDYNKFVAFIGQKIWLKALRAFDHIVFLTEFAKSQYAPIFHHSRTELNVVYNGRPITPQTLDTIDNSLLRQIQKIKKSYKIIGSHCLVTNRKGLDQILRAMVSLPDYYFVHIGKGEGITYLKKLSVELKVSDRCLFLGYHLNAQKFLEFFDVYAMPSSSEGFPLALLEAGNKEIPIVCSDISIFKELFSDQEVSFFELRNIKSLESAIINAFQNRRSFGINIKMAISNKYSVESMAEKYLSIYKN